MPFHDLAPDFRVTLKHTTFIICNDAFQKFSVGSKNSRHLYLLMSFVCSRERYFGTIFELSRFLRFIGQNLMNSGLISERTRSRILSTFSTVLVVEDPPQHGSSSSDYVPSKNALNHHQLLDLDKSLSS